MNHPGVSRPQQGIRQIQSDRPARLKPARRSKVTSGRSVSLALTSSSNMPQPPSPAPAVNKKLAVRLTTVTGCAGLGLYARKPSPDQDPLVFRKGETIKEVEGTLALRQIRPNNKSLSWLVNQHYCHPLANDSRVLWSDIHYPKKNNVELGCYPRCIAVYSNDTQQVKPNIRIVVTNNLPKAGSSRKQRKLNLNECPTYTMVALNDIFGNEELLWSYGREGKDLTDYSGSYVEPYNQEKHKKLISNKTHNVINLEEFPVIVEDSDAFDQLRITHFLGKTACNLAFTEAELTFCKPYFGLRHLKQCLIEALEKGHFPAYLKLRLQLQLEKGRDMSQAINNIRKSLIGYSFTDLPLPRMWVRESTTAALYEYCVNQSILFPHQDVETIPYPWLRLKLEECPDDRDILELLAKKIRLKLEAPNSTPAHIASKLCREFIYNPLSKTTHRGSAAGHSGNTRTVRKRPHADSCSSSSPPEKKSRKNRSAISTDGATHWSVPDLETFTEIATNRISDPSRVAALINQYKVHTSTKNNDTSFKVADLARAGHLQAQVAIVRRRIPSSSKIMCRAAELRKRHISLWIDGQHAESSTDNMVRFIKTHFTDQCELKRMLRIKDRYNTDELLEKIDQPLETRKGKHTGYERALLYNIHEMDHDNKRIHLSKEYIRRICTRRKIKRPSEALTLMKSTRVLQKEPSQYTQDDLKALFQGENGAWFHRMFPNHDKFSKDDWSTLFLQSPKGTKRMKAWIAIRNAHNTNPKIIQKCIKDDCNVLKNKPYANKNKWFSNFCFQRAVSLNKYDFTKNNQPHTWGQADIREMVKDDTALCTGQ